MKRARQSFPLNAEQWLTDERIQSMTLEEEGAYIRALCYCWREGSIPADLTLLSRLCKGASENVLGVVVERFIAHPVFADRLIHTDLENERTRQEMWRLKSAQGGLASAHKRKNLKHKTSKQYGVPLVNERQQQHLSSISSFSSNTEVSSEPQERVRTRFDRDKFELTKDMRDNLLFFWDFDDDDAEFIAERFLNYWDNVPESQKYKKSWKMTFYSFLRDAVTKYGYKPGDCRLRA